MNSENSSRENEIEIDERLLATVIICSRNRASSLSNTLKSIVDAADQLGDRFPNNWELVVVDNGSTDNTPAVVESFQKELPIRRVMQPLAGLSNARNAGVANAKGQFIMWTDDDVDVDVMWLKNYLAAFEKNPHIALFGGRAVPRFQEPIVPWFTENTHSLASLLAIRDAPEIEQMSSKFLPFGLNYAIRTDVQKAHQYDPNLGVAPGRRIGGEESAVIRAILHSGHKGIWVWDATVFHLISPQRQTLSYIFDYYKSQGLLYPRLGQGDYAISKKVGHLIVASFYIAKLTTKSALMRILGRSNWAANFAEAARWCGTFANLAGGQGKSQQQE